MAQWTQGVGQRRLWKAEEFDGLKPTVYDWCRVAAFLDIVIAVSDLQENKL